MARKYRVLVGLNYPSGKSTKRAEPGDVIADIPAASVPWLVKQGVIEAVSDKDSKDVE